MTWRQVRLWAEILGLSFRHRPGRTIAMIAIKTVGVVAVAGNALLLREAINSIIDGHAVAAGVTAAGVALAFATTIYLDRLGSVLRFALVDQIGLLHLHQKTLSEIASLDGLDHLERTDFLDRVTVLRSGTWGLVFGAWTAVDLAFNLTRLALLLALLGSVSPWLLVLLLCASAPVWCDQRGQRSVSQAETDTAEAYRLQRHLFSLATEAPGGKEIRVAGAGEEIIRQQARAWKTAHSGRLRAQIIASVWKLAGWTLFTGGFAGTLILIMHGVQTGTNTIGDIVLAITIAVSLRDAIADTVNGASQAFDGRKLVEPHLWLRDRVAAEHARAAGDEPTPPVLRDGISLDHVTFTYPGTDRPALDDVTCHFPAGSVVAIVGEYGSGKTTLVKLLCKFYRPDQGTIVVDGVDLARLATDGWRARTSTAFQDFGRFQLRFAETVGLGDLVHINDHSRINQAVESADAQALVDRLPAGLDTQLGHAFDGVELSEGQWQKTALARASMRTDPLLFVLDEPTASLDAPSEHAIFERYRTRAADLGARTGAITVIVSHRFSTITAADQILVMDEGRLIEAGTHTDLIRLGGRYAELYGIQANAYAENLIADQARQ